ncbi:MAG: DNA mismatch repair endonuclease MutL [Bacteroidales bacterium]|jgi:DNA mismatch repair protein MutL|nr:DNA mismatch repair endonuclease MutL [Bacteroidales bacterium]
MSDIIHVLPDSIANQIAAGEVIQRPASVIKELVENAVDAGAEKIDVIVKNAGKTLIQINDNGCGMSETDARLCFERHATSKINNADDLFNLHTKGFRGEALASIAAISYVELRTRQEDNDTGTSLVLEGSRCKEQTPCTTAKGTSILVKNLFFNVPARRNFLKSDTVEYGHIHEEFLRIAFIHPEIAFSLYHNDKLIYNLLKSTLKQRIIAVLGNPAKERLIPVEQKSDVVDISGFIGKPEFAKKTRGEQYMFVNNRFIKHPYFHHAITSAFEDVISANHFPTYFICFNVHPNLIDVNIHPTKTEVKFQEEKIIYSILRATVKRSIGAFNLGSSIDFDNISPIDFSSVPQKGIPREPTVTTHPDYNPFHSPKTTDTYKNTYSTLKTGKADEGWQKIYESIQENTPAESSIPDEGEQASMKPFFENEENADVDNRSAMFQTLNKYIVARIKSGFVVIEPEAAMERILYERYNKYLTDSPQNSQKLLFPETLTFSPQDSDIVHDLLKEFRNLGFDMEAFGKNTFILNGVPADVVDINVQEVVEQLLESYKNNLISLKISKRNNMAHSLAMSVGRKKMLSLSEEEMQSLVQALFITETPHVAPSGKKICITFKENDLIRMFR